MSLIPWSHATSAGFTLRGWRSAPSGKPLLHFLHGNGFCGRTYEPMLQRLEEDFDLWLCDLQGQGDSDHGGRFVGWNRSAELAAEAFASREGYSEVPCVALGHSFGGVLTSLILANHPGLFHRAVLLDPVLFSPSMLGLMAFSDVVGLYRRTRMAGRARRRRQAWPDRTAAADALRGRGMFRGWQEEAFQAYIQHALKDDEGGVRLKCAPEREADVFGSFPRRMWSALNRIETPTHVMVGQDSYPFVATATARLCRQNARVSQQTVKGGHCFMQEDPAFAAAQVRAFLRKC